MNSPIQYFYFILMISLIHAVVERDYYEFFSVRPESTLEEYNRAYEREIKNINSHFYNTYSQQFRDAIMDQIDHWRSIYTDPAKKKEYDAKYQLGYFDRTEHQERQKEARIVRARPDPTKTLPEAFKKTKPNFVSDKQLEALAKQFPRFGYAKLIFNSEDYENVGAATFHAAVDGKDNTVVIVKSINPLRKTARWFGGFSDKSWDGFGVKKSGKSMIFSINQDDHDNEGVDIGSQDWKVETYNDDEHIDYSIYADKTKGPTFMYGFSIGNNSKQSASCCLFGESPFVDEGEVEEANLYFCGGHIPQIEAYAVYQLTYYQNYLI